jgi:UDP-N-acetylglucosamine 2-epimerase (non-hydrolysing)
MVYPQITQISADYKGGMCEIIGLMDGLDIRIRGLKGSSLICENLRNLRINVERRTHATEGVSMKVFLVAGARPNFMKIAPIYRAAEAIDGLDCRIVHTGQHYDHAMSQSFYTDLGIPEPSFHLEAGSGSHAVQTGKIMVAFEEICEKTRPDLVMVVGDVNSTLACSVVAKKMMVQVAHVEAGLRSFDLSMPEEINRMVTDAISDLFFVTEESGSKNLLDEGKSPDRVHFVGHVMIDNLFYQVKQLETFDCSKLSTYPVKNGHEAYAFLTLHRPSNVDSRESLNEIASALDVIAEDMPIFFPVHPRTRKMLDAFGIALSKRIVQLPPLGFKDALFLWKDARMVLTDSGGLQEETTALKVPCLTLRENTERPITIEMGSNILAGTFRESILAAYEKCLVAKPANFGVPPLWDGHASERIWEVVRKSPKSGS